jgi:predicted Rossmann fold flavoprotein
MKQIVVIGGGPAGMMAAVTAAARGAQVLLLEKKNKVGRKLAITGKGRCNITTAVDTEYLTAGYPGKGKFLYSCFSEFSNRDVINFFEQRGLKTKVERGNRVFPESDRALDVIAVLQEAMVKAGVRIFADAEVHELVIEEGKVKGVKCGSKIYDAAAVIVCTGGLSYPGTGSTGDGYRWARRAGHKIVEPQPGLVPLLVQENWVKQLQGLSLKNVQAYCYEASGKLINQDFGEMLFTHFGLSGPIVLTMSRDIGVYLRKTGQKARFEIDLKPALDDDKLDQRLQRDFARYSRRNFNNALDELLPQKLIPVAVTLSGIDPHQVCSQITREARQNLGQVLKHLTFTITGTRPIAEAIVTAGGIDVSQIKPRTMESKIIEGLYFAGEVLDVDGYTGGYNLQAAFSTGYAAGKCAAAKSTESPQ